MATFTKTILSGSTDGKQIKVMEDPTDTIGNIKKQKKLSQVYQQKTKISSSMVKLLAERTAREYGIKADTVLVT